MKVMGMGEWAKEAWVPGSVLHTWVLGGRAALPESKAALPKN